MVSTLAGGQYGYLDGTGTAAKFKYVRSLVVNGAIFAVDPDNYRVRMVTTSGIQLFYCSINSFDDFKMNGWMCF